MASADGALLSKHPGLGHFSLPFNLLVYYYLPTSLSFFPHYYFSVAQGIKPKDSCVSDSLFY